MKEIILKSTPLHHAASEGHIELVELLIGNGAHIEALNNYNHTPLVKSIISGKIETTKLLLDCGAVFEWLFQQYSQSITSKSSLLDGGLHIASKYGHNKFAKVMIECGADENAVIILVLSLLLLQHYLLLTLIYWTMELMLIFLVQHIEENNHHLLLHYIIGA